MNKKGKRFAWLLRAVCLTACLAAGLSGCGARAGSHETVQSVKSGSAQEQDISTDSAAKAGESRNAGDMTVHFLDVGQGLSILVQSEGQTLLYDGGGRSASSFTVAYLERQGVAEIDYMISSHYDEDHVAGLIGCLNAFDVRQVIGADYEQDTKIYQSFMNAVEAEGLTVLHPAVGDSFDFGSGSFTVLAPASIGEEDNGNSVVIRLDNGENSFLFTGDANLDSEAAMCAAGLELSCDVLSVSHHGSATATGWDFLQAAVPEYAVVSCGAGNSYGHPHKDVCDRLEAMGIPLFRTDLQGTVTVTSDGTELIWDQEPCNDYSPGEEGDTGTQPQSSKKEAGESGQEPPKAGSEPQPSGAEQENQVWISASGSKYHSRPDCGTMNPEHAVEMTETEAAAQGYEPCGRCFPE